MGKVDGPPIAAVGVEFLLNKIDDGRGGGQGTSTVFLTRTNTDRGLLVPAKGGALTIEIANAPADLRHAD